MRKLGRNNRIYTQDEVAIIFELLLLLGNNQLSSISEAYDFAKEKGLLSMSKTQFYNVVRDLSILQCLRNNEVEDEIIREVASILNIEIN